MTDPRSEHTPDATAPRARSPRRAVYLIIAGAIAVIAVTSVLVAAGSDPETIAGPVDTSHLDDNGPAPKLVAKGWINSEPLDTASIKGKVVLYDFWTYSCINCVRTFPHIRALYDRYRDDGLVVIGVHSPEFEFEKDHANVEAAVKRLHVTWPVALDDEMTIWSAFANQYWPADYIADRQGRLRYEHFGEGDYDNTEDVVRTLLGLDATAPRIGEDVDAETASGEIVNPETYLDLRHEQLNAQRGPTGYPRLADVQTGDVALEGGWDAGDEHITATEPAATIALGMHAQSVNLVLASATGKAMDVIIELDGKPVPENARGASIHEDARGQTVITVDAPDMYRLVLAPGVEEHRLTVTAEQTGLEAYAFTFG